ALGIVDGGLVGQRRHGADAGYGHHPPHVGILARGRENAVRDRLQLLGDRGVGGQQRVEHGAEPVLLGPELDDTRPEAASLGRAGHGAEGLERATRMPVLLTCEEEVETWLRGSPDEAFALVRAYPAECMRIVQEGLDKENLPRAT